MKKIMLVISDIEKSHALLKKAMKLSPEHLTVLLVNHNPDDQAFIQEKFSTINKTKDSGAELTVDSAECHNDTELAQLIVARANDLRTELIMLHKQSFHDAPDNMGFIKELLRGGIHAKLMFCYEKKWKKIPDLLCAVDIDETDAEQKILNDAVFKAAYQDIGPALSANLHLATVIEMSTVSSELDIIEPGEVLDKKYSQYKESLLKFETTHPCGKVQMHVRAGIAAKEIPSLAAKQKVDIVVIGNVGRKGIKGFFFGNTAEKTFRTLACDVLIVNKFAK